MKVYLHRRELQECLYTEFTCDSLSELYERILHELCYTKITINDITIRYYCYDESIKAERYLIVVDHYGVYGYIHDEHYVSRYWNS